MKLIELEIPDYVILPRKRVADRKYALNLNVYRNMNFQVNNDVKIVFTNMVKRKFPFLETIKGSRVIVSYTVLTGQKRKFDTMNIISIVDKFFIDSLVSCGVIEDDTYDIVEYGEGPRVIQLNDGSPRRVIAKVEVYENRKKNNLSGDIKP